MIRKSLLEELATQTGFRTGAIEKVLLLQSILSGLVEDERLEGKWVLKGGTALNLFQLNVPRLSVDIDLNFIGEKNVSLLPDSRKEFESIISSIFQQLKCTVKRVPTSHAGGKFRLRYTSTLGGEQNLEVDVNYLLRVPLLPLEMKESNFPPSEYRKNFEPVPTLSFEELVAGKCAALVFRTAARDVYDMARIVEEKPNIIQDPTFRLVAIVYFANGRQDIREIDFAKFKLEPRDVKDRLLPLLQVEHEGAEQVDFIASALENKVNPALKELLRFSETENQFLSNFLDKGEIRPEFLTSNVDLQKRIKELPTLLWKQKYIKERLDA